MARVKTNVASHRRKKRVLKAAKGRWGDLSKQYIQARRSLMHGMVYAYRDRRVRKREFRALWIARISAACREAGLTYSRFMDGLKKAKIEVNRKMLSEIAATDSATFSKLIDLVKKA